MDLKLNSKWSPMHGLMWLENVYTDMRLPELSDA